MSAFFCPVARRIECEVVDGGVYGGINTEWRMDKNELGMRNEKKKESTDRLRTFLAAGQNRLSRVMLY